MEAKLYLFNTLTREKEEFKPIQSGRVSIYTCGPTVYDYPHIGNFRTYIFSDLLIRVLNSSGYQTKSVQNITDVGHLTGDRDMGEDKLEESARVGEKSTREIVDFFTSNYLRDRKKLFLLDPDVWAVASKHISEQVEMIEVLEKKGFTYETSDGIYFNTSLLPDYGKLAHLDIDGLREGARVEVNVEKKNPTDFALWKFSPKDKKREQEWSSPWGTGFPGWHIECSSMSKKYLGDLFDIHTGGVDFIPVHHTNEIAQNEGVSGTPGANYWIHGEFLTIDGQKMSKSLGNTYTLENLEEKGYSPLSFKYFTYSAHYRQQQNFTWEALESSQITLDKLVDRLREFSTSRGSPNKKYWENFREAISDDLNMPQALSVLWAMLKDEQVSGPDKMATAVEFDKVLGLDLENLSKPILVPQIVLDMVEERNQARKNEDWSLSDKLRERIRQAGFLVLDTPSGTKIRPQ